MSAPTSTSTDPVLALMCEAFAATMTVVESLSGADIHTATPCPGWDVGTVVEHIAGALEMFAAALGATVSFGDVDEPVTRLRALTSTVEAAWATPGRLETTVQLPFGAFPAALAARINALETFVHGVDIAVATGREDLVRPELCEAIRDMAEAAGFDTFRQPGMFGPEVEPRNDSPVARLLAFVGRTL